MRRSTVSILAFLALAGVSSAAQAALISYVATLNGPNESPPNASTGTGTANVDYDNVAHTLHVHVVFSGLTGTTTASHIHSPTVDPFLLTANVATTSPTFLNFPLGVQAGTYDITLNMLDTTSWNSPYVNTYGPNLSSVESAFISQVNAGKAYLNIHTNTSPGGEIRGFLVPVPEPGSLALLTCSGLFLLRRRRSA